MFEEKYETLKQQNHDENVIFGERLLVVCCWERKIFYEWCIEKLFPTRCFNLES